MVHKRLEGPLLRAMWMISLRARAESGPSGRQEMAFLLTDTLDQLFVILLSDKDRTRDLTDAMVPLISAGAEFRGIAMRFLDEGRAALNASKEPGGQ